ncbi:MAG: cytochrome c biogenesis protein ResB [Spirochaetota bacterium]
MNAVYKFLKSTRLAIVLILVIILFALLGTLIPQGRSVAEYKDMYSPFLYWLISFSGLQNYTSALLFWVPILLFILNLGVCTIDRLVKRAKNKAVKHFGPDLIHVGLLILAIGALITATVRREQDFTMRVGDSVNLSDGYAMNLSKFEFIKYPDGRPKAWISTVDVSKDGKPFRKDVKIEVNHPLAIGLLKVYQMNYGSDGTIILVDAAGDRSEMKLGQGLQSGDTVLGFASAKRAADPTKGFVAEIQVWKDQTVVSSREVAAGEVLGSYTVASISADEFTGLRAAADPGFIPVLIALMLGAVGLTMTSIHKSKGDL